MKSYIVPLVNKETITVTAESIHLTKEHIEFYAQHTIVAIIPTSQVMACYEEDRGTLTKK